MMISKIEDYSNSVDKKNLILCYLLSTILIGLIYYNFNYSILDEKIQKYNYQIKYLENIIKDDKSFNSKLKQLKKSIKILKTKNFSLKEDIKYLNALINSCNMFNINEKKFFTILKDILQKAVDNKIKASYKIKIDIDKFKVYSIHIDGGFNKEDFFNFFDFIKNLESIKNIKKIEKLLITKKDNSIKFFLIINFWSIL